MEKKKKKKTLKKAGLKHKRQNCRDLCSHFLWSTYCKSEVELSGHRTRTKSS